MKDRYPQKKLSLNEQAAAFFIKKDEEKIDISQGLLHQQLISNAERQGKTLAKAVQHLISEDETKFLKFVDGLYNFYELKDSRQFIDFLMLFGDAYDIPHLPEDVIFKTDKEKADAYCIEPSNIDNDRKSLLL